LLADQPNPAGPILSGSAFAGVQLTLAQAMLLLLLRLHDYVRTSLALITPASHRAAEATVAILKDSLKHQASKHLGLLRNLGGEHIHLLDFRRLRKQFGSVRHKRGSNGASEMSLAPSIVCKRIEYRKRRRPRLQSKPH
jgi:hypothetical protein